MKHRFQLVCRHVIYIGSIISIGLTIGVPSVSAATTQNPKLAPCAVSGSNPKTTHKIETISFNTITQHDNTLPAGQTKTIQTGHVGKRLITYSARYKKAILTGCKHTGTTVTVSPLNTVVSLGTYVAPPPAPAPQPVTVAPAPVPAAPAPVSSEDTDCSNGTYVNSAGNTVCSPEAAPSAPAGATAQCRDGTYSFSQSRSGTCSHHGGVSSWL